MAKKCKIEKWKRRQPFGVREHNRCHRCGRPRGYIRFFGVCRICFRQMALRGELPGVRKGGF